MPLEVILENPMLVKYDTNNSHLIDVFLRMAGNSLESFRYFQKRGMEAIENHLVTYFIVEDDLPICYGHLDKENGKIWLGIAVLESYIGRGFGHQMMKHLIDYAINNEITEIFLSVDIKNIGAITLYEKYGFRKIEEKQNIFFYKWSIETYERRSIRSE